MTHSHPRTSIPERESIAFADHARQLRTAAALLFSVGAVLLLHVCLARGAPAAQSQAGTVEVRPDYASVDQGNLVTVAVWLVDAVDTYGLDVRLDFDPDVISATEIVPRWDLFDEEHHILVKREWDNEAGTIWYAVSNQNPAEPFTGTGRVCSLVFQGQQVGTSPLAITYAKGATRDGEPITPTREDGQIDVRRGVLSSTTALALGWNLISEPLIPASTVITELLSSIEGSYDLVYAYDQDGTNGTWRVFDVSRPSHLNSLADIDREMGFWIRMTEVASLTVEGIRPVSTSISLRGGWNLAGYPSRVTRPVTEALASIEGSYDLVYAYHAEDAIQPWRIYDASRPAHLNSLTVIEPWRGLWIRATEDCVLRVDYE